MHVILINESIKSSFLKSRRILSKYLKRVGHKTWLGSISEQGLSELYYELKKVANKNTSIACHKIISRKTVRVIWFVGSKSNFNIDGEYSFKNKRIKNKPTDEENKNLIFLKSILSIAALCHDLGKASISFQEKLRNNNKLTTYQEKFRHEIISGLIFLEMFNFYETITKNCKFSDFIGFYTDKEQIFSRINDNILTQFNYKHVNLNIDEWGQDKINFYILLLNKIFISLTFFTKAPIFFSILWLIITHHKIPSNRDNKFQLNYFNSTKDLDIFKLQGENKLYNLNNNSDLSFIFDYFNDKGNKKFNINKTMIWSNTSWVEKISKNLSIINNTQITFSTEDLYTINLYILRPLLISGDVLASKKKEVNLTQDDNLLYANTHNHNELNLLADPLDIHLIKTNKYSKSFFNLFFNYNFWLSSIEKDFLISNELNLINQVAKNPKFQWQDIASDKIAKINNDEGFLGFIISQTGAGKTLGSLKIAKHFSSSLRLSYLVGFRSLAIQTSEKFKQIFSEQDIITLIGNIENLDIQNKLSQDFIDSKSNENENNLYLNNCDILYSDTDNIKYNTLINHFNLDEKVTKIFNSPILVGTIDHFIPTVIGSKSSETSLIYRLATSNFILDEIDSYSASDLLSLGKFLYVLGLFGRKCLILSATLTSEIFLGLSSSYERGFKIFSQLNKKKETFNLSIISDLEEPIVFNNNLNKQNIYDNYIGKYKIKVDNQSSIKYEFLSLPNDNLSENSQYELLFQKSFELHKKFHIITRNNKKISIGFIRFNNTSSCINFSSYIEAKDHSKYPFLKLICYHSKFPNFARIYLDSHINNLTNRNTISEWESLIESFCVDNELMIIISTTSIIETGRDHDYDWGILEPNSIRSFIQSSGRILRHRIKDNMPRLNIMNFSFNKKLWEKAGVNDNIELLNFDNDSYKIEKYNNNIISSFNNIIKINAIPLLLNINSDPTLDTFEHKIHYNIFIEKNKYSLESILYSTDFNYYYNSLHNKKYPFRYKNGKTLKVILEYYNNKFYNNLLFFDQKNNKLEKINHIYNINYELNINKNKVYLFNLNPEIILKHIEQTIKISINSFSSLLNFDIDYFDETKTTNIIYDTQKGILKNI